MLRQRNSSTGIAGIPSAFGMTQSIADGFGLSSAAGTIVYLVLSSTTIFEPLFPAISTALAEVNSAACWR
ncbi:MAG: hypothetical protein ACLVJ6_14530 [Merdibacter sp.]